MTGTKEAPITTKNELTLRKSFVGSKNSKKEMESSRNCTNRQLKKKNKHNRKSTGTERQKNH
jgi:hypothetical protein